MTRERDPPPAAAAAPADLAGLTIVIAEDNWLIAEGLKTVIERHGGIVAGLASTVDSLRALVVEKRPDAVIADLDLRGETAAPLVEELANSGTSIVVITGYPVAADQAGNNRIVRMRKPVAAADLIAALCSLCDRSRG